MNLKNNIFFILMLLPMLASAQEKLLRFRVVVSDSTSVANINVVNLVNEKSSKTDINGEFTILAKADDLLILQKETLEYKRYQVEPEDVSKNLIFIPMISKPIALDQVTVTKKERDDLAKTHADPKKFTQAERRLYTARTGILDPLLNALSGRTKQLKKELDVEYKLRLLARAETIFEERFYVETLKIPLEYIGDFQYYLIDHQEFVAAMKDKNRTLMRFEAAKLAASYRELMEEDFKR